MEFLSFRGHDLRARKEKIKKAMLLVPPETAEDVPVLAHTSCYFAFGNARRPEGYWTDPAVMLAFQQDGYERHLNAVRDDVVPYFMPWFGTGVLATAFGCPGRESAGAGDEPTVTGPAVSSVEEAARLKMPDLDRDGWMPRVARFMDYAVNHGEMPVGPSDLNSPLSTALQVCGYENFLCWMYEEPHAVEDVMALVTEAFIRWVRYQKRVAGEAAGWSNGLQGLYTPVGGVWLSDDDLINIGPEFYRRFVLPHYRRIYEEFGGGHLHWCGRGSHQFGNLLALESANSVNNSPMGDAAELRRLFAAFSGKKAIILQDVAPADAQAYYGKLFEGLQDLTGLLVSTFVTEFLAGDLDGASVPTDVPPERRANAVVKAVRDLVGGILAQKAG